MTKNYYRARSVVALQGQKEMRRANRALVKQVEELRAALAAQRAGVPDHLREFIEAVAQGHTDPHPHTQEAFCSYCHLSLDYHRKHKDDCLMLRARYMLAAHHAAGVPDYEFPTFADWLTWNIDPPKSLSEYAHMAFKAGRAIRATHPAPDAGKVDGLPIPHTLGAFTGSFYYSHKRQPTPQEIFDAGMRSGRDIQWPEKAAPAAQALARLKSLDELEPFLGRDVPNDEVVLWWKVQQLFNTTPAGDARDAALEKAVHFLRWAGITCRDEVVAEKATELFAELDAAMREKGGV